MNNINNLKKHLLKVFFF